MRDIHHPVLRLAAACLLAACGSAPGDPPADGGHDGAPQSDSATPDAGTTNHARVFAINPVTTPDPIDVDLADVADDQGGALTSAADGDGVRRLRVLSCEDEGETVFVMGIGTQRICTLRHRADKETHGHFVYQDWDDDVAGIYQPDDVHAEVSLYYHAARIYDLLASPEVGLFDRLPGVHDGLAGPVPINLVANYRLPAPEDATALSPATVAFFVPADHMRMGMDKVQGLLGYDGDFLVFGQAASLDFAYDGETVYHELGHLVIHALADLDGVTADPYGLTHLGGALNEGLADTFALVVSGNPSLFAYLDERIGGGFGRPADNDYAYPADLVGLGVKDGMIISGANWEVLALLEADAALDATGFARVLLLTLERLAGQTPWTTYQPYADAFTDALTAEGLGDHVAAVTDIFADRGLYDPLRAVDITAYTGQPHEVLFTGGALDAPWNTWLRVDEGGGTYTDIAPAYVQATVTTTASATAFTVSAVLTPRPTGMTPGAPPDLDYRLYLRAGAPVGYTPIAGTIVDVTRDLMASPTLDTVTTPSGPKDRATWHIDGLVPDTVQYLHFVNYGETDGVLSEITVTQ